MKIAVIAVGYNRPDSIDRLCKSLTEAEYQGDRVDLIISIDKGPRQAEVISVAEAVDWNYGEKKIRAFSERQGLRPHILQCGDLTLEYDAVIVLEDDVTVSKGFYAYVKQALAFYGEDERIAGISLYSFGVNTGVCRPFTAAQNGYDTFIMQVAQSWGQCWSKGMWSGFKTWYEQNAGEIAVDEKIPAYIARWNDRSWLKYYNKYIIQANKFFIYPYCALSTDHSEAGEHCAELNNDYQVPLLENSMTYRFPKFESAVKYDAFFERMEIAEKIFPELKGKKLLDLLGGRTSFGDADYLISVQALPYRVVKTIALTHRPAEVNCFYPVEGKGIYIYDLHTPDKKPSYDSYYTARYDLRALHWKKTLRHGLKGFVDAVMTRLKR